MVGFPTFLGTVVKWLIRWVSEHPKYVKKTWGPKGRPCLLLRGSACTAISGLHKVRLPSAHIETPSTYLLLITRKYRLAHAMTLIYFVS